MKVSVCIPTHRRPALLARCLDAVLAQEPGRHEIEVVVVDDGSPASDGVAEVVAAAAGGAALPVRYERLATNRGAAAARNTAWRLASGEWIAFTDDDCRPRPDWLRRLLASVDDVDIIQGCTVPDPAGQHLVGRPLVRTLDVPAPDGFFQTCNIAYRRAVLEQLDGFDVTFARSGEDTDLAWRARAAGARTAFRADAVVEHAVVELSWRQDLRARRRWSDMPALLGRHPGLGDRTWWGPVYRRSHALPLAVVAATPLLASRRGRRAVAATLAAVLAGDIVAAGSPVAARAALATRLGDAVETAVLAGASIRAGTVLL
ncbi:glycosyltransferase [Acidimicrobiia bacterium EGI L10123]|uniref:glycosyltransferase family 2 protein n=1 Tax=Salinilacustrithrix flava TaxID=2957203 RepID=UPI003D7C3582|nr:glycosyltransferase [Acidimicrobiia bacterium EGI L10123]